MNRKQRRADKKHERPGPQKAGSSIQALFAEAIQHHHAGRVNEAEQLYQMVLRLDPHHAEALHILGILAHQTRRLDLAASLIGRAIEENGKSPAFHSNLGIVLKDMGKLDEAVQSFGKALSQRSDLAQTHYNLGIVLQMQGKLDKAVLSYRRALSHKPDYAEAQGNLGNALQQQGKHEEAAAFFRKSLISGPDLAVSHSNLGTILAAQGRLVEAALSFERALCLSPDNAEPHSNLGNTRKEQGKLEEAVISLWRALILSPNLAEAYVNLGNSLQEQGKLDAAVGSYKKGLTLKPDLADGEMSLVLTQLYRTGVGLADILVLARRWSEKHAARFQAHWPDHARMEQPAERLPRLGFVSADFRNHAVGFLVIPAIEGLARAGYHVTCYSNSVKSDGLTDRFVKAAAIWRPVTGMSDDALVQLIRADGIDILIDLSGNSAGNRLLVFARKPAPIQVTWVGSISTSGMAAIDYFVADRHQLPPGAEPFYTESLVRLPESYVVFEPPTNIPAVNDPPVLSQGAITFGSFNMLKKITPDVVEVWSRILTRLPPSRLIVKALALNCAATQRHYAGLFAGHGIAEERLQFVGGTPQIDHLTWMSRTDIALDPFPYAGGRTTLEALWMGLPVVTLPSETLSSRHSLSYLSTIGVSDLAANGAEHYVELAVGLANDTKRLAGMRAGLRPLMLSSPLCDTDRFSSNLAAALNRMWRRWCDGLPPESFEVPSA